MDRPRRVVYSLPDGAQTSVLLRSPLFDRLTSRGGIEWVFVSPLADDEEFARPFRRPGVTLRPWPAPRLSFLDRQVQFIRQELWKLRVRSVTAEVFTRRMRWAEPKRYHLHRRIAAVCRWIPGFDSLLNGVEAGFIGDRGWGTLLDEVRPVAVVLGSGGTKLQEMPLGRAARRRGVPSFGIIPSWDNLTSKGPLVVRSRRLGLWCDRMRQEAVELYNYRPEEVIVTGPPPFDPHMSPPMPSERQRFFKALGLDPGRKLITYTSVPPAVCPFSAGYVELLARYIHSGALREPCQLLVRMHPQDDFAAFDRLPKLPHVALERPGQYRGQANGNQAILYYDPTNEDVRHLTETLAFSDVVVNIASTITLEACALDRPVINLAFNLPGTALRFDLGEYYRLDHYLPVTESGAAHIAWSEADLVAALNESLARPNEHARERRALYRQYDPFGDGCATNRLGDAILSFVDEVGGSQAPAHYRRAG